MIEKQGEVWTCTKCGKSAVDARAKFNLKRHIEVHIEGVAYECDICGKSSGSKNGLAQHKAKYHRNVVFTSNSTTAATTSSSSSITKAHLPTVPIPEDQLQPIVAKRSRPVSPSQHQQMAIQKKVKLEPEQPEVKFQIHRLQEEPAVASQKLVSVETPGGGGGQQLLQQLPGGGVQYLAAPTMQFTSPTAVQFNLPPLPQYSTSQYSAAAAQYTAVLNSAVNNRVQFQFS